MTGLNIGLTVGASLMAFINVAFLVNLFWRKDDKREEIGKRAIDAIPRLSAGAHTILVEMARDIAVLDASDFKRQVKRAFEMLTNPVQVAAYFWGVCRAEVGIALADPEKAKTLWEDLGKGQALAPIDVITGQVEKALKDPAKVKQLQEYIAKSDIVVSTETIFELLEQVLKDPAKAKLVKDYVAKLVP